MAVSPVAHRWSQEGPINFWVSRAPEGGKVTIMQYNFQKFVLENWWNFKTSLQHCRELLLRNRSMHACCVHLKGTLAQGQNAKNSKTAVLNVSWLNSALAVKSPCLLKFKKTLWCSYGWLHCIYRRVSLTEHSYFCFKNNRTSPSMQDTFFLPRVLTMVFLKKL